MASLSLRASPRHATPIISSSRSDGASKTLSLTHYNHQNQQQQQQHHHHHCSNRTLHTTRPSYAVGPYTNPLHHLPPTAPPVPQYPYPLPRTYKQQLLGLYGSTHLQFGNTVAPKHNTKAKRRWRPNIKIKHLYSRALEQKLRLRVATRVLRTVDKVGGLDEYVTGGGAGRVKELGAGVGWRLRWVVGWRLGAARRRRERLEAEAAAKEALEVEGPEMQSETAIQAPKPSPKKRSPSPAGPESFHPAAEKAVRRRLEQKFGFVHDITATTTTPRPNNTNIIDTEDGKTDTYELVDVAEENIESRIDELERTGRVSRHMAEERGEAPVEEKGVLARAGQRLLKGLRLR